MSYKLRFSPHAKKQWNKLDHAIRLQFKKKLDSCLSHPHIPKNKLVGLEYSYKIKLRAIGYRLIYEVKDRELIVLVIAIGKRENNVIYKTALKLKNSN